MSLSLSKVWLSGMASSFVAVCLTSGGALADPPSGARRIDGIATLAGGRASDESDSIPVLVSDVDFEAALIALRKSGAESDASLWKKARRSAVLLRLLAKNAKQLGETVDPASVKALEDELTRRAGGAEAMEALLARFGASAGDLRAWAENALLATGQLKYMEDQVDIPSDREIVERMERETVGEEKNQAVYEIYRRRILKEKFDAYVEAWLDDLLAKSRVRVMK